MNLFAICWGVVLFLTASIGIDFNVIAFIGIIASLRQCVNKTSLIVSANLSLTSIGFAFLQIVNWVSTLTGEAKWPFDARLCGLFHFSQTAAQNAMSFSLIAVARDRYVNTKFSPSGNKWIKTGLLILFIWISSAVLGIPELFLFKGEDDHCANTSPNSTMSKSFDVVKTCINLPLPLLATSVYYVKTFLFFRKFKLPAHTCPKTDLKSGIHQKLKRLVILMVVSTVLYLFASTIESVATFSKTKFGTYVPDAVLLLQALSTNMACILCGILPSLLERNVNEFFFQ